MSTVKVVVVVVVVKVVGRGDPSLWSRKWRGFHRKGGVREVFGFCVILLAGVGAGVVVGV